MKTKISLLILLLVLAACSVFKPSPTPTVEERETATALPKTSDTPSTVVTEKTKAIPTEILITPFLTPSLIFPGISKTVLSIDVMKYTQDYACQEIDSEMVANMVEYVKLANATHIAISPPINQVDCGGGRLSDSLERIRQWVDEARKQDLNVWFRLKDSSMEGFYQTPRNLDPDYHIRVHFDFVKNNPALFRAGDIYTVNPEPQNAGISGVNCFPPNQVCLFSGVDSNEAIKSFNSWLVKAVDSLNAAFIDIGLFNQVRVGYFGFDGFVGWGDRNPDWQGIIDPLTIKATGNNFTFDHYYPSETDPSEEYAKIRSVFPDTELCIGEWGAIENQSVEYLQQVFSAIRENGITCINYWHLGPGGSESLLNFAGDQLVANEYYRVVQSFYASFR